MDMKNDLKGDRDGVTVWMGLSTNNGHQMMEKTVINYPVFRQILFTLSSQRFAPSCHFNGQYFWAAHEKATKKVQW